MSAGVTGGGTPPPGNQGAQPGAMDCGGVAGGGVVESRVLDAEQIREERARLERLAHGLQFNTIRRDDLAGLRKISAHLREHVEHINDVLHYARAIHGLSFQVVVSEVPSVHRRKTYPEIKILTNIEL